jgi:hypothetical protein
MIDLSPSRTRRAVLGFSSQAPILCYRVSHRPPSTFLRHS